MHEVQAYWYYKQNLWDSAAAHLVNALSNATTLQEKARWEYLAAQLYEMSGKYKESEKYYVKVSSHTTDPVLDIYARLYAIRVNIDGGEKTIDKNVAELLKMAKKDKFEEYQDIIYYMAAQMQLEGNNINEALRLLKKSSQFTSNDPALRNKIFLQLAELSFTKKEYRQASNFYDSLRLDDPALKNIETIKSRKKTLNNLATNFEIAARQDSLQRIAAMSEDERKDYVKKIAKELRKTQGLKDEPLSAGPTFTAPTLFPTIEPKGEWYFYNATSKTRGLADFKNKWGNRPNVDNWRRISTINAALLSNQQNNNISGSGQQGGTKTAGGAVTFDDLYANLPLTPEQLQKSNDSLQSALFALGKIYIQDIEDCKAGTETFEILRSRFSAFDKMEEVLFNLYYCYNKNGETTKADAIKKLMAEKFSGSNLTAIVTTGKNPKGTGNAEATSTYEKIYDLFIEGKFEQAIAEKKEADSRFGKNYWTPQLLYIEAVYHIKQRNDSTAIRVLNSILTQFPGTALAARATTLLDVLSRRTQIEEELRNMVVTRNQSNAPTTQPAVITKPKPLIDSSKTQPVVINNPPKPITDTIKAKPLNTTYKFNANEPYYVVLLLTKVDPVFCNEAKNAFARFNRETFYNKQMTVDLFEIDPENRVMLMSPFKDAQDAVAYIESVKPKTPSEILPWLKGGKYSFIIITDANFDLLKVNKDIDAYKSFLNQNLPGKF